VLNNLNDWRILESIQYKWDTAVSQAILEALAPPPPNRVDILIDRIRLRSALFDQHTKESQ
jgi:hypothetical protein